MANKPDVRVRLSAEGLQDVLNAFQKIQAEAAKTQGITALNKAFSELGSTLIGGLGVGAVVTELIDLGKRALDNAINIAHMSEKVGASTEVISALSLAATTAGVSQEDLSNGLVKLARSMDQAAQGSTKPLDAFKRLGISMRDIKSDDPGQMFVLLAQKMSGMEDGTKKAAIAQALLGRSGADLIPLLDQLANGGFEQITQKALRMGLLLDQDAVEGVEHMHGALVDLGNIAEGVATQFLVGFAPKAADAMETFGNAVTEKGVNGMKTFGDMAGYLTKLIVFLFVSTGQIVGSVLGSMIEGAKSDLNEIIEVGKGGIAAIKLLGQGDFTGAKNALSKGFSNAGDIAQQQINTDRDIFSNLKGQLSAGYAGLSSDSTPTGSKPKRGGGTDPGNITATEKARLAFLKAQADNELAITKTKNQLLQQENDRAYRDGLVTIEQYYVTKEQLDLADIDAEIANLEKKKKLTEQEPAADPAAQYKKKQEIAALDTKIDEDKQKRNAILKADEDEFFNAKIQHNIQLLQSQQRIDELEGNKDQAERDALAVQIAQTEDLLRKEGMAADKIQEIVDKIKQIGTAKVNFDISSRSGQQVMDDMDLAKRDIQRQAQTGQITGLDAQAKLINLEKARLSGLKDIGKQMLDNAIASGDPTLIQQAKAFNASVKDIEASLNMVGIALANLKNNAIDAGIQAFGQFFGDAASGAKKFSDAWKQLGQDFQKIISDMIAKLIELYLQMLIMNLLEPGSGGSTNTGSQADFDNMFGENGVFGGSGFAGGGYTGDGAKFAPAGIVHRGEYVFDQDDTRRFRPLFELIRGGGMPAMVSHPSASYAAGGYVQGLPGGIGGGSSPVQVNIDTGGQPATQTERQGADGSTIIDVIVGKVAQNIAQGGTVHKAIETTYGVRRQGRKLV